MSTMKLSAVLAAGLVMLLGCSSPAPEPASAEAVERAITEAELQLKAANSASEDGATEAVQHDRLKGETT